MARKLTDLTQATNISADDLMYLVDAPSGAKNDRSLSMATLFASVPGNLSTVGPDPWFDVTNPAYGAFNDGTNAATTTTGISAAITAANNVSYVFARGAIVWFPPGYYAVNATLTTPGPGVTLLGAVSDSGSVGVASMASTIKFTNTGAPLFDLGTNATSNVQFLYLDFEGSNASNILQRAIIGAAVSNITIDHCSFDQWGGQGIKFDGGADVTVTWCTMENCLKVYPNTSTEPADFVGALQLGTIENIVEHNNINGVAGTSAGAAGSGFQCAAYFSNQINTLRFNTFAFGQRGVYIAAGFMSVVVNNRFEYNQREGLKALSYQSIFAFNRFGNNSMDSNGGYVGCQIGDGGTNGYSNLFIGNFSIQVDGIYNSNKPSYSFFLDGGGGADATHHNEVIGNWGRAFTVALLIYSGNAPNALSPTYIENDANAANGANATIDSQGGTLWIVTSTTSLSGLASFTLNAPLNPLKGMKATLKIVNSSGGILTANLSVLKTSGYTDPANGKFKTCDFYYDGTNWIQIGAWSGDMS